MGRQKIDRQRLDRCKGAILGCAIGDALGITQETFVERPHHLQYTRQQVLLQRQVRRAKGCQTELEGGGPWDEMRLDPGEWTDDTAMMLCLGDSLLQCGKLDTADLMIKFRSWWYEGYNACRHNMSIGLGSNTQEALERFDLKQPYTLSGGSNPDTDAGNGALMRLAFVPVFCQDVQTAMSMARLQAQTTHNVPEAMDTCAVMAFAMWHAINGASKANMFVRLQELQHNLQHADTALLLEPNASWIYASEDDIITLPSRCLWTLEAALWCVFHTHTFEEALVKAINLGGDADTVGAVTGQIAGALYGASCIPDRWLQGLKHRNNIEQRAAALCRHDAYDVGLNLKY